MTRIIFLPDEYNVLLLHSDQSADAVLDALRNNSWRPPGGDVPGGVLNAMRLGRSLVLISVLPMGLPQVNFAAGSLPLSPRQWQVLRCLANGLTIRQTAAHLGLTERTAAFHVAALKRRLGAQTLAESISRAAGWLNDDAGKGEAPDGGTAGSDGQPGLV